MMYQLLSITLSYVWILKFELTVCWDRPALRTTTGSEIFTAGDDIELTCFMQSETRPEFTIFSDYEPAGKRVKVDNKQTDKGNVFFKYIKFTGTFEDNSRTFVCRANTSGNIVHSEPIMINIAIIPKAPRIFGPTTVVPGEEKTWICVSEGGSFFKPQVSFLDKADQKVQEKYGVTWTETETTDVFPHENYVYTRVLSITMSITEFPYTLVCEVVHPALKNEVSQRFSMRIEQEADSAVMMSKHALITSAQRVDVLDNTRRSQCQMALMSNVDNVLYTGQVVVNTTWAWREFLQVAGVYVELSSGFAGNLCFLKLDKKFCSEKPSSQSGNCYCKGFNSRNSEYTIVVNFTAKAPFSKAKLSIWWGDHQFERSQISMLPLILDSKKHVCVGFQMSESNKLNYLGLNSGKGHSLKAKLGFVVTALLAALILSQ